MSCDTAMAETRPAELRDRVDFLAREATATATALCLFGAEFDLEKLTR